jgi:hypothetical protein
VAVAVDFHGEHQVAGKEVHDVALDRLLPVEIESLPLTSPQMLPEQYLRKRALAAECSRAPFETWVVPEFHMRGFIAGA